MSVFQSFLNELITIEISGNKLHTGTLIDYGKDIVVLYNGTEFIYFPIGHIKNIRACSDSNIIENITPPSYEPMESDKEISYRKTLQQARGRFVEIYVSGAVSIHGYVTTTLNNYFVFYSPVYKTLYIPMYHLKWLIPYSPEKTPFSIERERLPVSPTVIPLMRTFEDQLSKLIGEIVIFDLGVHPEKIGLLKKIDTNMAELVTSEGKSMYWSIHHIMSVHSPKQL